MTQPITGGGVTSFVAPVSPSLTLPPRENVLRVRYRRSIGPSAPAGDAPAAVQTAWSRLLRPPSLRVFDQQVMEGNDTPSGPAAADTPPHGRIGLLPVHDHMRLPGQGVDVSGTGRSGVAEQIAENVSEEIRQECGFLDAVGTPPALNGAHVCRPLQCSVRPRAPAASPTLARRAVRPDSAGADVAAGRRGRGHRRR